MTTKKFSSALGNIGESYVDEAATYTIKKKSKGWIKWGYLAAGFAVMLMTAFVAVPMMFNGGDSVVPPIDTEEAIYEIRYFYGINEGGYSTYVGGRVIAEDKIGNKIADVFLTAGWKNAAGEWTSETEKLRGEVYTISGVSNDVAVALKFIDKGEAVTTIHYYVIMNPSADLTPVKDYVITPVVSNNPGDEMAGEVTE